MRGWPFGLSGSIFHHSSCLNSIFDSLDVICNHISPVHHPGTLSRQHQYELIMHSAWSSPLSHTSSARQLFRSSRPSVAPISEPDPGRRKKQPSSCRVTTLSSYCRITDERPPLHAMRLSDHLLHPFQPAAERAVGRRAARRAQYAQHASVVAARRIAGPTARHREGTPSDRTHRDLWRIMFGDQGARPHAASLSHEGAKKQAGTTIPPDDPGLPAEDGFQAKGFNGTGAYDGTSAVEIRHSRCLCFANCHTGNVEKTPSGVTSGQLSLISIQPQPTLKRLLLAAIKVEIYIWRASCSPPTACWCDIGALRYN